MGHGPLIKGSRDSVTAVSKYASSWSGTLNEWIYSQKNGKIITLKKNVQWVHQIEEDRMKHISFFRPELSGIKPLSNGATYLQRTTKKKRVRASGVLRLTIVPEI
ncbi:MAG TPA: hypothetical protein VJ915_01675 [Balneolaceae bacterium]|nr:hypothetical protein [Balneolaceae bacterium]